MKKAFIAITTLCAIGLGLTACGSKELKNVRGLVKSLEVKNDSLKSMVLSVNGEDQTVTLDDAKFQNGIALQGDSIILDYIDGQENSLRGLVVTVLPKQVQVFEPSDTLITKESTDSIQ